MRHELKRGVLMALLVWGGTTAMAEDDAPPKSAERSIQEEVVVDAPRSAVWEALTTTDGVTTFFSPQAHVELRNGGLFQIDFVPSAPYGQRGSEGCEVLAYVPEETLCISWNAPPKFVEMRGKRTFVVFQLEDSEDGKTRVKLTNGGYGHGEKWDETFAYFSKAWPHVLANLKKRFEDGPLFPEEQRKDAPPPKRKQYAYYLHPVEQRMIEEPTAEEQSALKAHVAYIQGLLANHCVIMAGPAYGEAQFPDSDAQMVPLDVPPCGIVVFQAIDDAEAKSILEGDPAVKAGVFKGCVYPFSLAFRRP